jgi:hypothetical protein
VGLEKRHKRFSVQRRLDTVNAMNRTG